MTLAQKIVQLRENAHMSQKELAKKLGVSTGTVAEWESEDSVPTIADISNLSTIFKVSTDILIKDNEAVERLGDISEREKERPIGPKKKVVFKRVWFWVVVLAVIIAAAFAAVLLPKKEVAPKVDETGTPIFVELTDNVYFNAEEYLGYYVNVKGMVFQNLGNNGESKGVHIWIDPDNCEKNMMIHSTTDESFKGGDYIVCSGYIKEINSYTNAYGTELSVPLIYSTDLRKATYIEVMSPTVATIAPDNLIYEKHGYSIAVDKVEFAENETRIYLTVANNSGTALYVDTGSSIIIQNGRQYNSQTNYTANYAEIPYNLSEGVTASGVVAFPAIDDAEFEYSIKIHSDDIGEGFDSVTFEIGKDASSAFIPTIKPKDSWDFDELKYETLGYAISVDKIEFYDEETRVYLTAVNDGKAILYIDAAGSVIVQNKKQYNTKNVYNASYEELPYSIAKGASVTGAISFPAVDCAEFEYTIEIHSDDYNEEFPEVVFVINSDSSHCKNIVEEPEKEPQKTETPAPSPVRTYPSAVGTYSFYDTADYVAHHNTLTIYDDGTLYLQFNGFYTPLSGIWTQTEDTICYSVWDVYGEWNNPFYDTVYDGGIDFLGDYYSLTSKEAIAPNKNQEAVTHVEELVKLGESPTEMKSRLMDVSGFSSEEADYGILHANVDWTKSAIEKLDFFVRYGETVTRQDCKDFLSIEHGYRSDVVQFAFENVSEQVDWSDHACNFISDYGGGEYTKEEVVAILKGEGFFDSEITEAMQSYADEHFQP